MAEIRVVKGFRPFFCCPGQGVKDITPPVEEQEGSVWWKISGSPMPQRQGWRISMAAGGAAAELPHQSAFLPAALALEKQLHDQGRLLLPPHGIWPALQIEPLPANEIRKEA